MQTARRMAQLGTETAFSVSAEASAYARKGNSVYPFHLGDINLPTPPDIIEATVAAMRRGKTGYCASAGIDELREALASDINRSHGTRYAMQNVSIQPGGKPVIGKFFQALLNPGDEALYPNPGYPIYESMIEYCGGKAVPYPYIEGDDGFHLDVVEIEKRITSKTRFLVFNNPQNPLAADSSSLEVRQIADIVSRHNLFVLCDEAYFDIRYSGESNSLASTAGMEDRCVLLYTFSKKYAMTGWRLGAAVGPIGIIDSISRLNVNMESCSNHFVQYGALAGLTGDQSGTRQILATLLQRRNRAAGMLNAIKGIRCAVPDAAFYLFPNVTEAMDRKGISDYNEFRTRALYETGVSFCTRLHFGRAFPEEKNRYLRFAYSGIELDQIEEGLARFKNFIEK